MIVTGIQLAMHYTANIGLAFNSVEHITRDVNNGWLLRYMHANGASTFFILVYIHIGRGLYFGSYRQPRGLLWSLGTVIFIVMMATAFIGKFCLKWYNYTSNLCITGIDLNQGLQKTEDIVNQSSFSIEQKGSRPEPEAVKFYDNQDTIKTQQDIRNDNRGKAGIYCIYNKINGKIYIGSAITNRINVRFRNHFFQQGSSNIHLKRAIHKYGINNFKFIIQEYFPGLIQKENQKKSHIKIQEQETEYIAKYNPEYNILKIAQNSQGYKHTSEAKSKMTEGYSEERKSKIGNMNRNRYYSPEERYKQKRSAIKKYAEQPTQKKRISEAQSKGVILYKFDGSIHSQYYGIRKMSKAFNCCHKTINKCIKNNTIFKGIGLVKLSSYR